MADTRLFPFGSGGSVLGTYGVMLVVVLVTGLVLAVVRPANAVIAAVLLIEVAFLPILGLSTRSGGPARVVLTHLGLTFLLLVVAGILMNLLMDDTATASPPPPSVERGE